MSEPAPEPAQQPPAAPQSDGEILAEIRDLLVKLLAVLASKPA